MITKCLTDKPKDEFELTFFKIVRVFMKFVRDSVDTVIVRSGIMGLGLCEGKYQLYAILLSLNEAICM